MAISFKVHFTRYLNGERRISTPQYWSAESFVQAAKQAEIIAQAMRETDPYATFDVYSIYMVGCHGKFCDGATMWETAEELSARVAPLNKGAVNHG